MPNVVTVTVTKPLQLTRYGKKMIARAMYAKGNAFLGAAMLLRRQRGYEYVVLHLLCQGVEIVLKGILLSIDYDKYKPQLKRLGHDLVKVTEAVIKATGFRPLRPVLRAELRILNIFYAKHLLRYGSDCDLLINPNTISSIRVLRRIAAVQRLVEKTGALR